MVTGRLNHGMLTIKALKEHSAWLTGSTGPSRHLGEELKGPLTASGVGKLQAPIGEDDADQSNAGKVMPLCEHLGADNKI